MSLDSSCMLCGGCDPLIVTVGHWLVAVCY
jgi:hypothetical protein